MMSTHACFKGLQIKLQEIDDEYSCMFQRLTKLQEIDDEYSCMITD